MDNKNTNAEEQQRMLVILNHLVELGKKKDNLLDFEEVEKSFAAENIDLDAEKTEKVFVLFGYYLLSEYRDFSERNGN